jgi:uncharacterized protein (TIGR03437 family)
MRAVVIPVFLFYVAFFSPRASASVASFVTTDQNITFTGLGGNAIGEGQSRVTWGTCVFDGTNTTCTVSATFTGLGGGGTMNAVLTYAGNGPSPLTATSTTPGGDLVTFGLTSGSLNVTLVTNTSGTLTYYGTTPYFTYINPTCTSTSPPCAVGTTGLTPNATITGRATGTFDATPEIRTSFGVISASNYGGFSALAPGTWMEIYGTKLATVLSQEWGSGGTSDFIGNQAPTNVGGTSVTIGGLPAFIYYVSPTQVNAQVPSGVGTGPQPVVVTTGGGSSTPHSITVNPVEPGLLAPAVFRVPAGQYVVALFPDGYTYVLPPTAGVHTARARPGDTIVLYGVGFGPVTPDSPAGLIVTQANQLQGAFKASFGGTPATVNFSGLTGGYLGLYQFNVVVPNVAASDSVPFTYSLGGVSGPQNLIIAVGN